MKRLNPLDPHAHSRATQGTHTRIKGGTSISPTKAMTAVSTIRPAAERKKRVLSVERSRRRLRSSVRATGTPTKLVPIRAPPTARRRTRRSRSVVPIALAGFQTVSMRPPSGCPAVWRSLPLRKPMPATVPRAEPPRAAMEPAVLAGRWDEANLKRDSLAGFIIFPTASGFDRDELMKGFQEDTPQGRTWRRGLEQPAGALDDRALEGKLGPCHSCPTTRSRRACSLAS
jgi:hypothetical protein